MYHSSANLCSLSFILCLSVINIIISVNHLLFLPDFDIQRAKKKNSLKEDNSKEPFGYTAESSKCCIQHFVVISSVHQQQNQASKNFDTVEYLVFVSMFLRSMQISV